MKNILGGPLQPCCKNPITGFYRDGFCRTDDRDQGRHVVCAVMTDEFLAYTRSRGNDLSTPQPLFQFPGLKAGDRWCLCALRWKEALDAGLAPPVILESTSQHALNYVTLEELQHHSLGLN